MVECGVQKTVWCVIWCKQENALKSDGVIWNLGSDIYLFTEFKKLWQGIHNIKFIILTIFVDN